MRILYFLLTTPPRLVSIVGWVAIALLIWFGGPLLHIARAEPLSGLTVRWGLIAALTLLGLAWFYLSRIRAEQRNMRLVDGLLSQVRDDPESAPTRPRDSLGKALTIQEAAERLGLIADPLGAQRRPWFLLLGPPRSGKSALIENAKLNADHYIGTGNTRDYDWWFSSTGIPILEVPAPSDTAYVGSGTEHGFEPVPGLVKDAIQSTHWKKLSDALADGRPEMPVDGVVLVLSLRDLLAGEEQETRRQARAMRAYLQGLQTRMGARFPYYLVFTMVDTIEGFEAFFQELDLDGREQVWGTTFPVRHGWGRGGRKLVPTLERVDRELKVLAWSLRAKRALALAPGIGRNQSVGVFVFPARFNELSRQVVTYLAELLQLDKGRTDSEIWLRGIYFTSSATGYGREDRKSYFVSKFFPEIVFKEVGLGRRFRGAGGLTLIAKGLVYPLLLVVVLSSLAWWGAGAYHLRATGERLAQQLESVQALLSDSGGGESTITAVRLGEALDDLQEMQVLVRDQPGWLKISGLYDGKSLLGVMRRAYHRTLANYLLPYLRRQLEQQLRASWMAAVRTREVFDLYLMLGSTKQVDADRMVRWARHSLSTIWGSSEGSGGGSRLERHMRVLLSLRIPPVELDQGLIDTVRQRIGGRTH